MGEESANQRSDFGKMEYGCEHYRRRCKIRAPCCNEVFPCRHCHNEAMNTPNNCRDPHELCRHDVRRVICLVCDTEQEAAKVCANCGVNMGEYFCEICKFYDDDMEKKHFHCDKCGICRFPLWEYSGDGYVPVVMLFCILFVWLFLLGSMILNLLNTPGSCYSVYLLNNHSCVENSMRHHCPICYEFLFDSLKDISVMLCGHTIHSECLQEMQQHQQYSCPICYKSVTDMTIHWNIMEEEIQATAMPEDYQYRKVWILCNDCNDKTQVYFHVIGHKCTHCNSYNTRMISSP